MVSVFIALFQTAPASVRLVVKPAAIVGVNLSGGMPICIGMTVQMIPFPKIFLPSFSQARTFRRGVWRLAGSPCFWRRRAFLSAYSRLIFSGRVWSYIERSGPRQASPYHFPHTLFAYHL